jgi:hypothetical protein
VETDHSHLHQAAEADRSHLHLEVVVADPSLLRQVAVAGIAVVEVRATVEAVAVAPEAEELIKK